MSPVQILASVGGPPLAGVARLAVLNQNVCAWKTDGSLQGWGKYYNQLTPAPWADGNSAAVQDVWLLGGNNTNPSFVRTNGTLWGDGKNNTTLTMLPCP